jgi:pimeloyl-ACP methyl ester carboxylesterase
VIVLYALLALLALDVLANLLLGRLPRIRQDGGVIETAHGPLHYLENPGQGPPIVFLHGMPSSCREFDGVRAQLANRHTIAFDRPGYAWSTGPPLKFSDQLDAIVEASAALGVERAVLVGHSFGGLAALGLAIRHPDYVARMLLLAPAAGGSRVPPKYLRQAKWMERMHRPGVRWLADLLFQRLLRKYGVRRTALAVYGPGEQTAELRRVAEAVLARPNSIRALANDRLLLNDSERMVTRNLKRIDVVSEIVHGERDPVVWVRNAKRLAEALPGSVLTEIDSGHQLPATDVPAVLDGLARLEAR